MGAPALKQATVLEVATDEEDGLPPVLGGTQESPRGAELVATLKAIGFLTVSGHKPMLARVRNRSFSAAKADARVP